MGEQLSLAGFESPRGIPEKLFFAVLPDAGAFTPVRTRQLCALDGVHDGLLRMDRLHVSLHVLGDCAGRPASYLAPAYRAGASVARATRSFQVMFDRAGTFGKGREDGTTKRPFVLLGGEGVVGLSALWQRLAAALLGPSAALGLPPFEPHLTLAYDTRAVDAHPVEPIRWTVRELVLVRSFVGQRRYAFERRWPLSGDRED